MNRSKFATKTTARWAPFADDELVVEAVAAPL
jgi:hypothetical protein